MKLHFKILAILMSSMLLSSQAVAISDDYPKTLQERKADEMGSLAGAEGITFKPGRIKNESTKTAATSTNKYLWQASIEVLSSAPLSSVDNAGGVIITDWYTPKDKQQFSYKINVFIKGTVISPDSIDVKVFERVLKNGHFVQNDKPSNLANVLEDKILRKARELYVQAELKD